MSVKLIAGAAARKLLDSPNPSPERHTFAELVEQREDEFPLLAKAASATVPAVSPVIEWVVAETAKSKLVHKNYCQIVRFPYSDACEEGAVAIPGGGRREEQLSGFLRAVEDVLRNGVPQDIGKDRSLPKARRCGGVRHYLGRDPVIGDSVRLRPLREPIWRAFTHEWSDTTEQYEPLDPPIYEWLAEFSLEVRPA